jgi:phosphatidyl-myo-inositol dimannoside synthase
LRILCLQHSSVFESFGGVEYYLDDFLSLSSKILGPENVHSVVMLRKGRTALPARPFGITTVSLSKNAVLSKIENRLSTAFFKKAFLAIRSFRPSLLVCSHVSLGPVTYALSRLTGIPYITVVYGIECWGNLYPQDEWCLKKSQAILSISHWTKSILAKRGIPEEKIEIFHPGLAPHFETVPPANMSTDPNSPLRLLTISRLDAREQYKGQDHVLEALALLKKVSPELKLSYSILGEGSDLDRLKNLAASLGVTDLVRFRGKVESREELDAIYREHDVFIMPSRFGYWEGRWRGEGFGIVFVEAAAFEIPSIAYACGGAMDILEDGENGILVKPDDTTSLAHAIEKLARDRSLVKKLGKRAKEVALSRFSFSAIQQELEKALQRFEGRSDLQVCEA